MIPNCSILDFEESIHCGRCEPECPFGAIFDKEAIPGTLKTDIVLNHAMRDFLDFNVAGYESNAVPPPEQVAANKRKWNVEESLTSVRTAREYKHEPSKRT